MTHTTTTKLSPYYQKLRDHLITVVKGLVSPDVDVYLANAGFHSPGWAFLDCKKHDCFMSLSYDRICGISLSIVPRPNKTCGTGYACVDNGLTTITPTQLDEACLLGKRLIAAHNRDKRIQLYDTIEDLLDTYSCAAFEKL